MRLVAIRSPGLAVGALKQAAEDAGLQLAFATSVEEAANRDLRRGVVLVDGVGETAPILVALRRYDALIERVIWLGFDAPAQASDKLVVVSPLEPTEVLIRAMVEALGGEPEAVEISFDDGPEVADSPTALAAPQAIEIANRTDDWDPSIRASKRPSGKPKPRPRRAAVRFEAEAPRDAAIDVEVVRVRRRFSWRLWLRPALAVTVMTAAGLLGLRVAFAPGPRVALPPSGQTMPTYPAAAKPLRREAEPAAEPKAEKTAEPANVPKPKEVLEASQPSKPEAKATGNVVRFDLGPLKDCTTRLGRRGKARFLRAGKLSVRVRLGVMATGHVAAASVLGVRIGKKRYRSKRFDACAEGAVVGQQLELRPEREPTFIKRTFTVRR